MDGGEQRGGPIYPRNLGVWTKMRRIIKKRNKIVELKAESGDGEVKGERKRVSPKARRHAAVELLDTSGQW